MSTWAEIIAADEYEYYGVRWVDEADKVAVGDIAPVSRVWVDGEPTDDVFDGACAVHVRQSGDLAAILAGGVVYMGRPILLGSMEMTYGDDNGEIIMRDARVLAA